MVGAITKYIDVVFDRDYKQVAPSVYRYDHGIALRIRGVPTNVVWQCHFSCRGNDHSIPSIATIEGNAVVGVIPDIILMQPREVICYLYYEDNHFGRTVYEIFIPVQGRARPASSSYTPQQIDAYDQLVAMLQSLIDEVESMNPVTQPTIAPDYDDLTNNDFPLHAGFYCWHDDILYRAVSDIPSAESWTAAHWEAGTVSGEVASVKSDLDTKASQILLAPTESSTTASMAHPTGSYFILSGTLYQTTVDIASGGTIYISGENQNCMAVPNGLSEGVSNVSAGFRSTLIPVEWGSVDITKGEYIDASSGETRSSSKHARTNVWNSAPSRIGVKLDSIDFEYCLRYYDETHTSSAPSATGYIGGSGYRQGITYIPVSAPKFALAFRHVEVNGQRAIISDEDVEAIKASLSYFTATDSSLNISGAAADAKVVGDAIKGEAEITYITALTIGGMLNQMNGKLPDDTTKARILAGSMPRIPDAMKVYVRIPSGYSACLAVYSTREFSSVQEIITGRSTFAKGDVLIDSQYYGLYLGADIKKNDGSDFTADDITALKASFAFVTDNTGAIGLLEKLKTTEKSNLVGSVNELYDAAANQRFDIVAAANAKMQGEWEQGSISLSTGLNSTSDTRIRTKSILCYDSLRYILISVPEGYKCGMRRYSRTMELAYIDYWGFKTGDFVIPASDAEAYRLILAKTDDSNITPAELPEGFYYAPVFKDVWEADACGESIGPHTTQRSNAVYVGELVGVADTYYSHRGDKTNGEYDMVYGETNTALSSSTYTRNIDCSTFVGLVLRGIPYTETQYYTKQDTDPNSYIENPDYVWSVNPFDYSNIRNKADPTPSKVQRASQLAEWMIRQRRSVPIDAKLANLEAGDVVFFAKIKSNGFPDNPHRFMAISHVAICRSKRRTEESDNWSAEDYPFAHEIIEVVNVSGAVHKFWLEDSYRLGQLVVIGRPDLGSL